MIQDIFPYKLNNQYDKDAKPNPEDRVMCFDGPEVLIQVDTPEGMDFPRVEDLKAHLEEQRLTAQEAFTYLFSVDSERYYLLKPGVPSPRDAIEVPGAGSMLQYYEVRGIRKAGLGPKYRVFAALTGKHLWDWYRDSRFCGRCGHKMEHSEKERAMVCPDCKNTVYPRIMPAVIVGITNGDKILLTKYQRGYQNYALVAGFTEIGETLEETVAREAMEETGLKVKNIRYYKSQPWGIANDILMGYYCDVDGSTEIHRDDAELKVAEWVERGKIELQPDDYSLTNEMMQRFQNGLET